MPTMLARLLLPLLTALLLSSWPQPLLAQFGPALPPPSVPLCTTLPSPPGNGSMAVVSAFYQYSFSCNAGFLLSGTPSVTCLGLNQWSVNTAACISIQASGGCTTRSVAAPSMLVQCQPNEMVVSGTVNCGGAGVLGSKPMPSMQAWYGLCSASAADASIAPVSVTASCCQFAADTFSRPPAGQLPNPTSLPVLPERSFLQSCEYQQGDSYSTVLGGQQWGLSCPAGKSAIAGGVVNQDSSTAPMQWFATLLPTSGSQFAQEPPLLWAAGGSGAMGFYYNVQSPPVELSAICCAMVSGAQPLFTYLRSQSTNAQLSSTALWGVSCPANTFETGAGVNLYSDGTGTTLEAQVNCIPTSAAPQSSSQAPAAVLYCSPPSGVTGALTLSPAVPTGSQLIPVGTTATLSCDSLHYATGATFITCLSSGQWNQPLGSCNAIDQTSCFTVEATAITGQTDSGITVSCPLSSSGIGSAYTMISGGVSCGHTPNDGGHSAFVTMDYPTSLYSRKGGCNSYGGAPVFVTVYGTCCLTSADPLFGTCSYQSSSSFSSLDQGNYANFDCGSGNFALAGGAACDTANVYSTYNTLLVSSPYSFYPAGPSYTPQQIAQAFGNSVVSRYWSTMCINPYENGVNPVPWTTASAICCSAQNAQAALLSTCYAQTNFVYSGSGPPGYIPGQASCPANHLMLNNAQNCQTSNILSGGLAMPHKTNMLVAGSHSAPSWTVSNRCYWDYTGDEEGLSINSNTYKMATFYTCCPAPVACSFATPFPPSIDSLRTPVQFYQGSSASVFCAAGYAFATQSPTNSATAIAPYSTAMLVPCQIDVDGIVQHLVPACLPTPCSALAVAGLRTPDGHGSLSAASAFTGGTVTLSCDSGYAPQWATTLECLGDAALNNGNDWFISSGNPLTAAMRASLCQQLSTGSPVIPLPALNPYSQNISFSAYSGSLHAGAGPLEYQVLYEMLFPDPAQLSAANALENGLQQAQGPVVIANVTGSQPLDVAVLFDANAQIEGVQALVTVEAGQMQNGAWLQLSSSSVLLTGRCGCYANNPAGLLLNPQVVQALDADNSLTVSFLPQSLCAKDYKVQQWNASLSPPGWSDVPLPILQTYYAENANYCSFLVPFTTEFVTVSWSSAGRPQSYRIVPLPMPICDGCIPQYSLLGGAQDPSVTFAFTPAYWFTLQGAVASPTTSSGAAAPIAGVTVTATVVNEDGSALIAAPGSASITASTLTDVTGSYSLQLASTLLTAQYYTVATQASRTDSAVDTSSSVLTNSGASSPFTVSLQNEDEVVLAVLGSARPLFSLSFAIDPLLSMNLAAQLAGTAPVQGPTLFHWLASDPADSATVAPFHQGLLQLSSGAYVDLLSSTGPTSAGAAWVQTWGGIDSGLSGLAGWTFELVFKLSAGSSGNATLLDMGSAAGSNELSLLWLAGAQQLQLSYQASSQQTAAYICNVTLQTAQWYHLVVAMEPVAGVPASASWFVYLNGLQLPLWPSVAPQPTPLGVPSFQPSQGALLPALAARPMAYLGRSLTGNADLNGALDAFRIYDLVLLAGTVQQLANAYGLYSPNLISTGDPSTVLLPGELTVQSLLSTSPTPAPVLSNIVPTLTPLPPSMSAEDQLVQTLLGPLAPALLYSLSFASNPLAAINQARMQAGGFQLSGGLSYVWEQVDPADSAAVAAYHTGLVLVNASAVNLSSVGQPNSAGGPAIESSLQAAQTGSGWSVELVFKLQAQPGGPAVLFDLQNLTCGLLGSGLQLQCAYLGVSLSMPVSLLLGQWYSLALLLEPVGANANWYLFVNGVQLGPLQAGTAASTSYGGLSSVSYRDGAAMPALPLISYASLGQSQSPSVPLIDAVYDAFRVYDCLLPRAVVEGLAKAYGVYTPALLSTPAGSYPALELNATDLTLASYAQPVQSLLGSPYSQWGNASLTNASQWQLVQLAPGAVLTFDDGSFTQVQVTSQTLVSAVFDYVCPASVLQHVVVNASLSATFINTSAASSALPTTNLSQLLGVSGMTSFCNASNAASLTTIATVSITNLTSTTTVHVTTPMGRPEPSVSETISSTTLSFSWSTGLNGSQGEPAFAAQVVNTSQPYLTANGAIYIPGTPQLGALTLVVPRGNSSTNYSSGSVVYPPQTASLAFNSSVQSFTVSAYQSQVLLQLSSGDRLEYPRTALSVLPISASALSAFDGLNTTDGSVAFQLVVQQGNVTRSGAAMNLTQSQTQPQPLPQPLRLTLYTNVTLSRRAVGDHLLDAYRTAPGPLYPAVPLTRLVQHQITALGTYPASATLLQTVSHSSVLGGNAFVDNTVTLVSGRVLIGYNALLPGVDGCGMPGIVMQAFASSDTAFSSPLSSSIITSDSGAFQLTVPSQQTVVLRPFYNGSTTTAADGVSSVTAVHSFSPPTLRLSVGLSPIVGLQLFDTTTNTLSLQLLGGLCQAFVANVRPVLILDSCGSVHFPLGAYSRLSTPYALPAVEARLLSYTADPLDGSGVVSDSAMSLSYQTQLNAWLVSNAQLQLDLRSASQSQSWTFYNATTITVQAPLVPAPCLDALGGTGLPFDFAQQGQTTTVNFQLTQAYGYSPPTTCTQLDVGSNALWLFDSVSDIVNECTQFGCAVTPSYADGLTSASYSTVAGDPYLFPRIGAPPYTRDLRYGLAASSNPSASVLFFFVTGSVSYSGVGSIPFPPSSPLYILRDPPGGSSFASITSVYTATTVQMSSTEEDQVFSLSENVQAGVDDTVMNCVGPAVVAADLACSNVLSTVSFAGVTATATETVNAVQASQTSTQAQYSIAISTSTDPGVIDGQGDLFLLVVSNLDFSLAVKLAGSPVADSTVCNISPPVESLTYSWDPNRYLQWLSAGDIAGLIIPEAQQQLAALQASPGFGTDASLQADYLNLTATVQSWQALLAYNEALKAQAQPFTDILSSTNFAFTGGQVPPPSTQPLGGALQGQTAFSFSGDSSSMTASVTVEVDDMSSTSVVAGGMLDVSTGFTLDLTVLGAKLAFATTIDASLNVLSGSETDSDDSQSNTVSFTLADPDQGDLFSVVVRKDTVYGSPVYVTTSGRSRCAAENNTIARESVSLQLSTASFSGIDPTDTVTTTLTLTNNAPFGETFGYFLNVEAETNTGGLLVSANGVALAHNALLLQLAPGPTAVTLVMARGPGTGYSFPSVELVLSGDPSACAVPYSTSVLLSVTFQQPCPPVEFSGPLAYSSSFILNAGTDVDNGVGAVYYPLILSNPEWSIAGRDWYSAYASGFLQAVSVQYALAGDNSAEWSDVVAYDLSAHRDLTDAANGGVNPMTQSVSGLYGFYAYTALLSGAYQFRAVAQCVAPANSDQPATLTDTSLYTYVSAVVTGLIDRTPPAVFQSEPSVNSEAADAVTPLYRPGDDISITYTEPILCQYEEAPGGVSVQGWYGPTLPALLSSMAGTPQGTQPMMFECSADTLSVDLQSPQWDVLAGQYLAVLVTGVKDLAHNSLASPSSQQLTMQIAQFNVSASAVFVTGLTFTVPPATLIGQMTAAASSGASSGSSSSSSSTGAGHRRLLQVDSSTGIASAAPPNSTALVNLSGSVDELAALELFSALQSPVDVALLSSELCLEIIAATNLEMGADGVPGLGAANPSGLQPSQLSIQSLGGGSLSVDFSISPCGGEPGCASISPSSAAHFFFQALMDDQLAGTLSSPAAFPLLSALLWPSAARTPTTSGNFGMSSPVLNIAVQPVDYAPGQQPPPQTATSSASSGGGSGSRLSVGAVGGIVAAGVVSLVACCALLLLLLSRCRRTQDKHTETGNDDAAAAGAGLAMSAPALSDRIHSAPSVLTVESDAALGSKWSGPQLLSPPARASPSTLELQRSGSPSPSPPAGSPQRPRSVSRQGEHDWHAPGHEHVCDAPSLHALASSGLNAAREPISPGSPLSTALSPIQLLAPDQPDAHQQ